MSLHSHYHVLCHDLLQVHEGVNTLSCVYEAKVQTKDCKYRCAKFSAEMF